MEAELGKQLLIRGARGSRKVTLTEEGMILRKRAEEILQLVKKAEDEITPVSYTHLLNALMKGLPVYAQTQPQARFSPARS